MFHVTVATVGKQCVFGFLPLHCGNKDHRLDCEYIDKKFLQGRVFFAGQQLHFNPDLDMTLSSYSWEDALLLI